MPVIGAEPRRSRFEPLWDRVDKNRFKIAAYIALFVIVSVLAANLTVIITGIMAVLFIFRGSHAEWLTDPSGLTDGFLMAVQWTSVSIGVIALAWSLFAVTRSEKWLIRALAAELIPTGEALDTKMMLKDMAIAAGMQVAPAMYRIHTPNVNAFIVAAPGRRPVVGVTQGFIDRLTLPQQRAAFANLVAREKAGDTPVATALTALMMPLHAYRDRALTTGMGDELSGSANEPTPQPPIGAGGSAAGALVTLFVFGVAMAILGEVIAAGHRHAQLKAAEKADAEGMLLLKDPEAMLSALERCVRMNNYIATSDETFAQLFYCWPGNSTDDEDDPEWGRIARLREVLGVAGEGWALEQRAVVDGVAAVAPLPPRLDE